MGYLLMFRIERVDEYIGMETRAIRDCDVS